jgi:biotin-(acetyl-CoA carboxylase) ligase
VVWAQRQVRGRGQRERIWQSQPKSSLTFSVLCRPTEDEQPLLGRLPRLEPWQWRGR